jgi:hypothetical protein
LTITAINQKSRTIQYILNYPNFEVKQAFMTFLFNSFTKNDLGDIQPAAEDLRDFLEKSKLSDLSGFKNLTGL